LLAAIIKSENDTFFEELEEFLKVVDYNGVDEEEFYKHLDFGHEDRGDEDCAISLHPQESTLLGDIR